MSFRKLTRTENEIKESTEENVDEALCEGTEGTNEKENISETEIGTVETTGTAAEYSLQKATKLPFSVNIKNVDNNYLISFELESREFEEKQELYVKVVEKLSRYIGMTLMIGYYVNNDPDFYKVTYSNQLLNLVTPIIIGSVFGKYITYVSALYYIGQKML